MLSSFKKPRKNASAAKQQKINVAKKLAARPVSPPSSDTDDDSDSEYEEILISSINGQPKKPNPKPKSAEPDEPNHANHFTEPEPSVEIKVHATHAEPIPIPQPKKPDPRPQGKAKSKKIVIKKYYQQRPAKQVTVEDTAPRPTPHVVPSYIGISSNAPQHALPKGRNPHSTMSSRILNW